MSDPVPQSRNVLEPVARETRRFSPALFGIITLCFLLPFASVTCANQELLTIKGLDLVLGNEVEVNEEFEQAFESAEDDIESDAPGTVNVEESTTEDSDLEPVLSAILALAAALIGVVLSLVFRARRRTLSAAIAAGVVFLSLLTLRFELSGENDAEGIVAVEYRFGYWIALLLGLLLLVVHGLDLRRGKSEPAPVQSG